MSEFLNNLNNGPKEMNSLEGLLKHLQTNQTHTDWVEPDGLALDIVPSEAGRTQPPKDSIPLGIGSLTLETLKAIFATMPVDLTFVDANDRVRFVSDGPNRVFIRPPSVIGRKVQSCHPKESLKQVEQILNDFRSGTQNSADFWLTFNNRFIFIQYFALRNEHQEYLGTLEVSQDLTHQRSLTGERRLLQYDT